MEVYRFAHEIGLEIFFLYLEMNNLEIKFWVKKNVSDQLLMIRKCLENVLKSGLGHRFDNNFEWYGIFRRNLNVLESTHSELQFEHKFFMFPMEFERVIVV